MKERPRERALENDIAIRRATMDDVPWLARMNYQLVLDDKSRNPMSVPEMETRMARWLAGDWAAALILHRGQRVGYCLYREERDEYLPDQVEVYLRQFFVCQGHRRRGIGRMGFERIVAECLPSGATLVLDVVETNPTGRAFWQAIGFAPYCTRMRHEPDAM